MRDKRICGGTDDSGAGDNYCDDGDTCLDCHGHNPFFDEDEYLGDDEQQRDELTDENFAWERELEYRRMT